MKHYFQSGLMLVAGVFGAAAATGHADQNSGITRKCDIREVILRRFLKGFDSPVADDARIFIREADVHNLDWRLLPSIAIVESGGGRTSRRNNIFGWANGASRFTSAAAAIHHVAEALSEARPYKGKDLRAKLAAYNPNPGYHELVAGVMRRISPVPVPESY